MYIVVYGVLVIKFLFEIIKMEVVLVEKKSKYMYFVKIGRIYL